MERKSVKNRERKKLKTESERYIKKNIEKSERNFNI